MILSVDPWDAILSNIHPDWKEMKEVLDTGPTIRPKLFKKGRKWHITLTEIWPVDTYVLNWTFDVDKLQTAVEWTDNTLYTWITAKRESWDTWSFNSKRDAEKFITYYNVACPQ